MATGPRSNLWAGLALGLVALALLPRLTWVDVNEDAGVVGAWAMQVAGGAVPYRDFWAFPTPGSILLYAGLFKVFGAGFLALRILTALAVLLACWLLFLLGRSLLSDRWSAAVTLLWGAWLAVFLQYGPHHEWGTLGALAMALALLRRRFLAAGVAASLALAFLQSLVPAAAAGFLAAWLLERDWRRSVLPMALGALAAGLPVLAYLVAVGALGPALADTVGFSVGYYRHSNSLPFPWSPADLRDTVLPAAGAGSLWSVAMFWPLVLAAPLAISAFAGWATWRSLRGQPAGPAAVLALVSTGLFLSTVLVRVTGPLLWFAGPLALVLVAARIQRLAVSAPLLAPAVLVFATGLSPAVYGGLETCQVNPRGRLVPVVGQGATYCVNRDQAGRMRAAREFAAAHPAESVAFLPAASSFYLFAGRPPSLPEVYVVPGVTSPEEEARLEGAMLSERLTWVLYFASDLTQSLPEDPELRSGQSPFDSFLAREYEVVEGGALPVYRLRAQP